MTCCLFGCWINSTPLVIIGFSRTEPLDGVSIELIAIDEGLALMGENTIVRSLEFAPEHYQAGVGILSYFGEVLKAKHPESNTRIRIEQNEGALKLHIYSPNGNMEVIEKTFKDYGLVVTDRAPVASLFEDPVKIMALEHKLEMARMEIRHAQNMLTLSNERYEKHTRTIENELSFMKEQMAEQWDKAGKNHSLLSRTMGANTKLAVACIDQNNKLIEGLIEQESLSENVINSLSKIKNKLDNDDVTESDEKEITEYLIVIKNNAPHRDYN